MTDTEARKQLVLDLFTTACEGGINYWTRVTNYHWWLEDSREQDFMDFSAVLLEFEDRTEHVLNRSVILKGLKLAGTKEVLDKYSVYALKETAMAYRYGGEKLEELDFDASTADAIVQLGIFGEVIYG